MMFRPLCLTSLLALTVAMPAQADMVFNRISAFATPLNAADAEDAAKPSSSEIIEVSPSEQSRKRLPPNPRLPRSSRRRKTA